MAKKRLIPFSWMPGSWGLAGKTRAVAQAEYELDGIDLDIRLAEIEQGEESDAVKTLRIKKDVQDGKLSEYESDKLNAELNTDELTKALALVAVELKHGKITKNEFEKQTATLEKRPWVTIEMAVSDENPSQIGAFELDWNEYFIAELKQNGYDGLTDSIIIEQWFSMTCATIAAEQGIVLPDPVTPEVAAKKKSKRSKDDSVRREYR